MRQTLSVISILVTGFGFQFANAQSHSSGFEVGAGISAFIYQGDLTPERIGSYRTLRPGIMLSGAKILNDYFSVRASLNVAGLNGNDSKYKSPTWRQERNLKFSSLITEVSAVAVYNFKGTNGDNDYKTVSPYVFGGVGATYLNTTRDFSRFNVAFFGSESRVVAGLATDIARRPTRLLLVFPVGVGARYPISQSFSIAVESNYRIAFSDYIDGYSQVAGPTKQDHYYSHTASVIYTFNSSRGIKCPVILP